MMRQDLTAAGAFGWESGRGGDVEQVDPLIASLADTAFEAARAGASVLAHGAALQPGEVPGVETKISSTDMVSDVDRASEAAVSDVIGRRRPGDGVLGEEGTSKEGTTGVRWVVDPLDGTTNFLFRIPQFCVSVAAEVDGQTEVGVVVDPSRGEIWAAARGSGAFQNGRRCAVPDGRSTLSTALVATGFGYRAERRRWQADVAAKVIPAVRDIRRLGSAALDLCWTGGGRFDAYFEWGLNPWDLAAGALVAAEAGAIVDVLGDRLIVAAVPRLFGPLRDLLESAGAFDAPPGPEPGFWESTG
jgi:myo-inositol-1(or 4)-monophosphatase